MMNYDRIILDLLNRVSILEDEVQKLKSLGSIDSATGDVDFNKPDESGYDKTKYLFNGVKYGKNRLVLAVVTDYCEKHKKVSFSELSKVFNDSLQGSRGVVRMLSDAKKYTDYEKRYFCKHDEIVHLIDGDCVVCTQWGVGNINALIQRARDLGMRIDIII